ncbi:hypothetical protein PSP6_780001 [Paraburkholderia tropica]|nr:hypothetical protein PSP6_780001 [Paraburkholderia tropica]
MVVTATPKWFRGIAQLAERRSPKPKVGGSIPSAPANFTRYGALFFKVLWRILPSKL